MRRDLHRVDPTRLRPVNAVPERLAHAVLVHDDKDTAALIAAPVGGPIIDDVESNFISIIDIQTPNYLSQFNDIKFDVESNYYLLKVVDIGHGLTPLKKDMFITGIYVVPEDWHSKDLKITNFVDILKSGYEFGIIKEEMRKGTLRQLLFKDDGGNIHTVLYNTSNSKCFEFVVYENVVKWKVIDKLPSIEKQQMCRSLELEEEVEGFELVGYNGEFFNFKENAIDAFRQLLKVLNNHSIKSIKIVQSMTPVKDAFLGQLRDTAVPVDDTGGGKFRRRYRKRTHHKKSKKSKKHHKMSKKQNKRSKTHRKKNNKKTHRKY